MAKSTPLYSGSQCLHGLTPSTPGEGYVKGSYVDIIPEISQMSYLVCGIRRYNPFLLFALLRVTCIGRIDAPFGSTPYHLEATDPRDKIYRLLGLAADRDDPKEFGVQPDYTQSCQEIYTSVTATVLRQGYLSVLSLSQFPKAQTGLLSWVPDWFKPLKIPLQPYFTNHMILKPKYKTSKSLIQMEALPNSVGATTSVSVSSFVYDEVHKVGAT